jgi:hypothetical protein
VVREETTDLYRVRGPIFDLVANINYNQWSKKSINPVTLSVINHRENNFKFIYEIRTKFIQGLS